MDRLTFELTYEYLDARGYFFTVIIKKENGPQYTLPQILEEVRGMLMSRKCPPPSFLQRKKKKINRNVMVVDERKEKQR